MSKTNVYKIQIFGYEYYKPATTEAKAKDKVAKELAKRYKPPQKPGYFKKYMKVTKVG